MQERLVVCPVSAIPNGGRGLRVIYAFLFEDGSSVADADPADRKTLRVYQEGYRQGNELFARLAGLEYDSSCKNPERAFALLFIAVLAVMLYCKFRTLSGINLSDTVREYDR